MTTLKLHPTRRAGMTVLVTRTAGVDDLSVCVQSALSTLVALAGRAGDLDCIDDGRAKASAAGDADLADLLRRALEELEDELARLGEPEEAEADEALLVAA